MFTILFIIIHYRDKKVANRVGFRGLSRSSFLLLVVAVIITYRRKTVKENQIVSTFLNKSTRFRQVMITDNRLFLSAVEMDKILLAINITLC